ncbi:MAG: hypothetical protein LQ351_006669 [Letrouitia transgressa]|nr:MAG: hypothetical protein LQ351_006669 [Letrouitia transgressa]
MPVAIIRFLRKYSGITATEVKPRRPLPIPTQKAWASNISQYLVHKLSMNIPSVVMIVPPIKMGWRYPASRSHPAQTPINIMRKIWMEPIQAITEDLLGMKLWFMD